MIQIIKQAAIDAVDQSSPTSVSYGIVTKVNPLVINVDQRMNISSRMILLTSNVIDKEIDVEIEDETEETNSHIHKYKGKKKYKVLKGLKVGEKVLLLRVQGGQKYIVWDRLWNYDT
ncbi:DUF2577 domain-containing protein [Tissierella sp. MB52-C2]|uniref:DUF2577 domain-containing protein n=1 Tax=Tissierella sp. MB52-C2 TaxID=3070999 RepID=UPI00280B71B0|nr:DUF2577 domain-containing protein [Tissierella sp. MB52-C2]WMM26997.1 DUF2577 domain-containing protein [Tissierella sp. MB52-C2]